MSGLAHVKEISSSYLKSDARTLESLDGALNETLMSFLRTGVPERQFVLEYIQNAVDAGARRIKIVLDFDRVRILVYNDGAPFSYDDFETFCKIAKSKKNPNKMLIGYIGIGAKSAFAIARKLELHSGNYHVVFEEANIPDSLARGLGLKYLWMIVPKAIDEYYKRGRCDYLQSSGGFNTVFVLKRLVNGKDTLDKVAKVLLDPSNLYFLDSRTLLFVPIKNVEVEVCVFRNGNEVCERRFAKTGVEELGGYVPSVKKCLVELSEKIRNEERKEVWLVISKEIDVPVNVRRDPMTSVFKRDTVVKRLIAIAFRIEKEKLRPIKGVVKFSVFSYMPIREIESGFNYLLHADFLTDPSRGGIIENILWNEWLRKELVKFVTEDVVDEFKHDNRLKYQIAMLLPHISPTDPFIYKLYSDLKQTIIKKEIILTYNGFRRINEVTLLPKIVYDVLNDDELKSIPRDSYVKDIVIKEVYDCIVELINSLPPEASKKLWHDYINTMYLGLRKVVTIGDSNWYKGVRSLYQALLRYSDRNKDFVKRMLKFMIDDPLERKISLYSYGDLFGNLIVLSADENVKRLKDVYLIPRSRLIEYLRKKLALEEWKVMQMVNKIVIDEDLKEYVIELCRAVNYCSIGSRYLQSEAEASENFLQSFVKEKLFETIKPSIDRAVEMLQSAIQQRNELEVRKIMKELVEIYYPIFKDKICSILKGRIKVKVLDHGFNEVEETLLPESDWHSLRTVLKMIDEGLKRLKRMKIEPSQRYKEFVARVKFVDFGFYQDTDRELLKQFLKDLGIEYRGDERKLSEFKKKVSEVLSVEIARLWLAKQGYFVPTESRAGWDIIAMNSQGFIIKAEVKGSTEEEYRGSIALRCRVKEVDECREKCGENEKCLIIIIENVAMNPRIRVLDLCKLPGDVLEEYRVELPQDALKYSESFKLSEIVGL